MPKPIEEELPKDQSLYIQTMDSENKDIELEIRQPNYRELIRVYILKKNKKIVFDWKKETLKQLEINEVFGLYDEGRLIMLVGGSWIMNDYVLKQVERIGRCEGGALNYKAFPVIMAFLSERCKKDNKDGYILIESKLDDDLAEYYIEQTKGYELPWSLSDKPVKLIVVETDGQDELRARIIKGQRREHHGK